MQSERWIKWMLDNPFRVFSVPADISMEELDEKIEDMRNDLQIFGDEDEQETEYDLEELPLPKRSLEKLSVAQKQLQDSEEMYRMFWFTDAKYCKNWTKVQSYEECIRKIPDASNYDAFLAYFLRFLTVQDQPDTFRDKLPLILRYMEHLKDASCFRSVYSDRNPDGQNIGHIQKQLLAELEDCIFQVILDGRRFGDCIKTAKQWENREFAIYIINDWCKKWTARWENMLKLFKEDHNSVYQENRPGSLYVQNFEYLYYKIYLPVRNIYQLWNHTELESLYCDSSVQLGIVYESATRKFEETGQESCRSDMEYIEKNVAAEDDLAEHIVMCFKERTRGIPVEVAKWAKMGADYGIYYMLAKYLEACTVLEDYKEVLEYVGKYRTMNQREADYYEGNARVHLGYLEEGEKLLKPLCEGEDFIAWKALEPLAVSYIGEKENFKAARCCARRIYLYPDWNESYDRTALGLFLMLGAGNPEWLALLMKKLTLISFDENSEEIGLLREQGYDYDFTKREIIGDGSVLRNFMILKAKNYDFAVLGDRLEDAVYKTEKMIQQGKGDYWIYKKAFYLRERKIFASKQTVQGDLADQKLALQWLEKTLELMPLQEERRPFEIFREKVIEDIQKLETFCRQEEQDPYTAYQGLMEYYKNASFILGQDAVPFMTDDKRAYYKEKLQQLEETCTKQKPVESMTKAQKMEYVIQLIGSTIIPNEEFKCMSREQLVTRLKQDIQSLHEAERVILSDAYLLRTTDTDEILNLRNEKITQLHIVCEEIK